MAGLAGDRTGGREPKGGLKSSHENIIPSVSIGSFIVTLTYFCVRFFGNNFL